MHLLKSVRLFIVFYLLQFPISVHAQSDTIPVYLSSPITIQGCHSNVFVIDSMHVDTLTTLSIHFQVRDSIGIADTSCTGITPIIVSMLASNPLITSESYNPDSAMWSCVLAPGDISFSLSVSIDCSVLQMGGVEINLSSVQLWQQWTSTSNDYYSINNGGNNEITSGNILSPWLVDESINSFPTAYGLIPDILFNYKNNGETADVRFYFDTNDGANCDAYQELSLEYGIIVKLVIEH